MIEAWEYILPDQSSCDGCTDCRARCTASIPLTNVEYREIHGYLAHHPEIRHAPHRAVWPGADSDLTYETCRFQEADTGLCAIYPVRPLICRLFGFVNWLPCPHDRTHVNWKPGLRMMKRRAIEEQRSYEEWTEENT